MATTAMLIAAGTWFGDKLLGPSADELGQRLRVYVSDRINKIVSRTKETAEELSIELKPLPPAFAVKMIQNASISDDDDLITEMWANLLISASIDYTVHQNMFSSILSEISGDDARALESLVDRDVFNTLPYNQPVNIRTVARQLIFSPGRSIPAEDSGRAVEIINGLSRSLMPNYPALIYNAQWPYRTREGSIQDTVGGSGRTISHDVLIRQSLLEPFDFITTKSLFGGEAEAVVQGVLVSALGIEFVLTCRGVHRNKP